MPEFVVERISRILNRFKKPINGSTILLLGVAYKKDIDDIRESPALKIISILEKEGAIVKYNDPYIPEFKHNNKLYHSENLTSDLLSSSDLVVITTDHTKYDYEYIVKTSQFVFDTRNATKNLKEFKEKIEIL
jgi:UDP-N-acetyl-D-glucosamine dehydrogenase